MNPRRRFLPHRQQGKGGLSWDILPCVFRGNDLKYQASLELFFPVVSVDFSPELFQFCCLDVLKYNFALSTVLWTQAEENKRLKELELQQEEKLAAELAKLKHEKLKDEKMRQQVRESRYFPPNY